MYKLYYVRYGTDGTECMKCIMVHIQVQDVLLQDVLCVRALSVRVSDAYAGCMVYGTYIAAWCV